MSKKSLKDSLQLNKPRRTPNHPTKSHVVKINDNGTERLIRFGQQGVSTAGKPKKGESKKQKARRKSFKARHAKNIAKGKTSAAYWANKVKWNEGGRVLGVTGDDPLSEAMGDRLVTQQRGALADLNDDGYIDIIDAYEFLRPSYPTEIAGALKQAGSNIKQGDIAKGMAMAGLGTLMAADYIPGAKFATSTIGRPIKSFLQDIAGNLPDTSVLEAASYKGRLGERLGSSPQQKMTVGQVRKLTEDISPTEKQFIEPELEDVRYQAKLQEMAGEKPDDTVTTEYLQKALQRRVPKSGVIREEVRKFDDRGVVPEYATTMRRPKEISPGYDPIDSDEYQELLVGLTPEMAVQYQKENMRTQGGNFFSLPNPHYDGYENTIFHIRSDRFQDNAIPGQKGMEEPKNVTFAEEMQSDTAIMKTKYGEFDVNSEIDLNSPRLIADKNQLAIVIYNEAINNQDLMFTYARMSGEQFLNKEAVEAGVRENIQRAFRELDNEKITLGNKAKIQEELQEEIDEIAEDIKLARQFIPEYKMKGDFTALRDAEQKVAELNFERERVKIKQRLLNRINMPAGVPKGFPFLKEWPKLAMQRLINEGVDNADDAIGWISGTQSADMRGSRRYIESFDYNPDEGYFSWYDPVRKQEFTDNKISYAGYRNRERIRDRYGEEIEQIIFGDTDGNEQVGRAFSKDIAVDLIEDGKNTADGPRQLYDTVMVKEAKKIGKKYGVEPYQTPNGDWRMDITDKMREDFLTDVTYAEGGSVELDLGMDERDFQREVTKQRSNLADYNNDGRIDSLDALLLGYDIVVPTDPRDIGSDAIDALKNIQAGQYMPALAAGTAALLGTSEYAPVAGQVLKGVTRPLRKALKQYDPNIVESRAEEIVKGAESRGGKGPKEIGTFFDKDGNPTERGRQVAYDRARKKIEAKKAKPLSEFLGDMDLEGSTKLVVTEADRSATKIGGGPGFIHIGPELKKMADQSGVKLADRKIIKPEDALKMSQDFGDPAWGVMDQVTASRLINQNVKEGDLGTNLIWTTLLGTDIQHMSNPIVFERLTDRFKKAVAKGKLPKEQAEKINHNLKLLGFPEGADIRDPFIWDMIEEVGTFVQRKGVARMIRGQSPELEPKTEKKIKAGELPKPVAMGGIKSRIIDTEEILRDTIEPELLGPNLRIKKSDEPEVQSMTVGPYAFSLDDKTFYNPSVHPGYPQILTGEAKQGAFEGVPFEDAFPQFMEKMRQKYELRKKTNPEKKGGFNRNFYGMSAKRGIKGEGLPTQEITEEYLSDLQKKGYQEGGKVSGRVGYYVSNESIEDEMDRIFGEGIDSMPEEMQFDQMSFIDKVADNVFDARATGGLEVRGGRNVFDVPFWDGEKISKKEITRDQLEGFAQLGLVKNINDNLIVDGSVSLQGGAGRILNNPFQGAIGAGPIEGGITYQTDQGDVRLGGRYDPQTDEKFIGVQGKLRFAKGGVYNAKKVDMMADQILEAYDV